MQVQKDKTSASSMRFWLMRKQSKGNSEKYCSESASKVEGLAGSNHNELAIFSIVNSGRE